MQLIWMKFLRNSLFIFSYLLAASSFSLSAFCNLFNACVMHELFILWVLLYMFTFFNESFWEVAFISIFNSIESLPSFFWGGFTFFAMHDSYNFCLGCLCLMNGPPLVDSINVKLPFCSRFAAFSLHSICDAVACLASGALGDVWVSIYLCSILCTNISLFGFDGRWHIWCKISFVWLILW